MVLKERKEGWVKQRKRTKEPTYGWTEKVSYNGHFVSKKKIIHINTTGIRVFLETPSNAYIISLQMKTNECLIKKETFSFPGN